MMVLVLMLIVPVCMFVLMLMAVFMLVGMLMVMLMPVAFILFDAIDGDGEMRADDAAFDGAFD